MYKMDKPNPEISYDLRECCNFIKQEYPFLAGVDFWSYMQSNIHGASQDTCYELSYLDEISYIEYKEYAKEFPNEEDFNSMKTFYELMVNTFGIDSYMRIWW